MMCKNILRGTVYLLFIAFPYVCTAGTGILEVYSEPTGAKIYINDVYVGKTPYSNPEVPTGTQRIKAVLSKDYPPQIQEVIIDDVNPQIVKFEFQRGTGGRFTGKEIKQSTEKFKGNVTFASIPTGAAVIINNGEKQTTAPKGFTDVEVGRYSVEFRSEGQVLQGHFDVIKGETVKLIADFNKKKIINKWDEAQAELKRSAIAKEYQRKKDEKNRIERQKQAEQDQIIEKKRKQEMIINSWGAFELIYSIDGIIYWDKYKDSGLLTNSHLVNQDFFRLFMTLPDTRGVDYAAAEYDASQRSYYYEDKQIYYHNEGKYFSNYRHSSFAGESRTWYKSRAAQRKSPTRIERIRRTELNGFTKAGTYQIEIHREAYVFNSKPMVANTTTDIYKRKDSENLEIKPSMKLYLTIHIDFQTGAYTIDRNYQKMNEKDSESLLSYYFD
jgi:hypothetical protein